MPTPQSFSAHDPSPWDGARTGPTTWQVSCPGTHRERSPACRSTEIAEMLTPIEQRCSGSPSRDGGLTEREQPAVLARGEVRRAAEMGA
jgi:hypothetical protein